MTKKNKVTYIVLFIVLAITVFGTVAEIIRSITMGAKVEWLVLSLIYSILAVSFNELERGRKASEKKEA